MRVLFVCSGNAYRSPVAEALFKKARPDLEVDSAGIHKLVSISHSAREYLERENAEQYLKRAPENLNSKEPSDYDLIVVMEPRHKDALLSRCPQCESRIIVWYIDDPYFLPNGHAEKIFEKIRQKVKELANSI